MLAIRPLTPARWKDLEALFGERGEPRGKVADAFVWTGLASAFRRAGCKEVARRSKTRPIMRRS